MKTCLLPLATALLFTVTLHAQSFQTNGLVAYFPFDGGAADAVGTNQGTVNGAVLTTNRFGRAGSAYSFNGTSSRIDFSGPPLTQVDNWTLAAWLQPGSLSQEGIAVHVGFDNFSSGDGYGMGMRNLGWEGLLSSVGWFDSGQNPPNTSQWHHVVMQRAAGNLRFFINGVQSGNANVPVVYAPTDFTIGAQNGARYFKGSIDEVRIYNRALSSNEITQLFLHAEQCFTRGAKATATVAGGFVVGATLTDSGCGYTNVPLVLVVGGGGSNATATASIADGRVTGLTINNPGCCYTNVPLIVIASPPFAPTVSIGISKVKVTQHVVLGRRYVLESSPDLVNWTPVGPSYTAMSETIVTEVDVDASRRYFQVREVP